LVAAEPEPAIPRETLPIVATAFAAGLMLGTRPGRHLVRGALRAGLMLVKPALVIGGLLKLRDYSNRPVPSPTPSTHEN
jgi:hypothetical protein